MTPGTLGRYRILRPLGSGGFAAVWLAEDPWLDTRVAIKVLADIHSNDADLRARFVQEARLLRRIRSPHVVTVYDVGQTDTGQPYFVMEEAVRGTLAGRLRAPGARGRHPSSADVGAVIDALRDGLGSLHAAGIVHRDLKPSNLLLQAPAPLGGDPDELLYADETIMLGDLGLAKVLNDSWRGLTIGAGTPGYAAPEQVEPNTTVDGRADVFGASACLAEILTGTPPPVATPPDLGSVGDAMARVLTRGMSPRPADRYPAIDEWGAAARAALQGGRVDRRLSAPRPVQHPSPASEWSRRRPRAPRLRTGIIAALLTAGIIGSAMWLINAIAVRQGASQTPRETAAGAQAPLADPRPPPDTAAGATDGVSEPSRSTIAGFEACGDDLCPSTSMCWGGLTIPGGIGREPREIDCSDPHYWETFIAGSLPGDAVFMRQHELMADSPQVARLCAASVMAERSRVPPATKGWDREPWPVQVDAGTWIVHCLASPAHLGQHAGPAFRSGACHMRPAGLGSGRRARARKASGPDRGWITRGSGSDVVRGPPGRRSPAATATSHTDPAAPSTPHAPPRPRPPSAPRQPSHPAPLTAAKARTVHETGRRRHLSNSVNAPTSDRSGNGANVSQTTTSWYGGVGEVPIGEPFSGSAAPTLDEAGWGVPNNQVRLTSAAEIRDAGGWTEFGPEPNATNEYMNNYHVNVYLPDTNCP